MFHKKSYISARHECIESVTTSCGTTTGVILYLLTGKIMYHFSINETIPLSVNCIIEKINNNYCVVINLQAKPFGNECHVMSCFKINDEFILADSYIGSKTIEFRKYDENQFVELLNKIISLNEHKKESDQQKLWCEIANIQLYDEFSPATKYLDKNDDVKLTWKPSNVYDIEIRIIKADINKIKQNIINLCDICLNDIETSYEYKLYKNMFIVCTSETNPFSYYKYIDDAIKSITQFKNNVN
jgi:hypothetical protein